MYWSHPPPIIFQVLTRLENLEKLVNRLATKEDIQAMATDIEKDLSDIEGAQSANADRQSQLLSLEKSYHDELVTALAQIKAGQTVTTEQEQRLQAIAAKLKQSNVDMDAVIKSTSASGQTNV